MNQIRLELDKFTGQGGWRKLGSRDIEIFPIYKELLKIKENKK